jgi:arsenate reductase
VRRLHWPLEDPAAAEGSEETILATFRNVRDQIEAQVRGLVRDLG